jgi:hypothetical protein
MGFPTTTGKVKSLRKFKTRTSESVHLSDEHLLEAYCFGKSEVIRLCQRNRGKILSNRNVHTTDSFSSCWERTRQGNGRHGLHFDRVQLLREAMFVILKGDAYLPFGKLLDLDRFEVFMKDDMSGNWILPGSVLVSVMSSSELILEIAFADCNSDPEIPLSTSTPRVYDDWNEIDFPFFQERPIYKAQDEPSSIISRMDSVDDDGAKSRVIGVTKGHLIDLEHVLRTLGLCVLKSDRDIPTIGWNNKTPDRTLGPDPPFDSADLTAATDTTSIEEALNLQLGFFSRHVGQWSGARLAERQYNGDHEGDHPPY